MISISHGHRGVFERSGALKKGHFVLTSGKHSEFYLNKTAALVMAKDAEEFARHIGQMVSGLGIEAVVGPELGAISLMADVRTTLYRTTNRDIAGVMALKKPGTKPQEFIIGRDQARFIEGKKVLIVEDILTTGDSCVETLRAVRSAGGDPVAVACLWNRGGVTNTALGVNKLFCVVDEAIDAYPEDDCPLCRAGVPVNTDVGHGKTFLEKQLEKQDTV